MTPQKTTLTYSVPCMVRLPDGRREVQSVTRTSDEYVAPIYTFLRYRLNDEVYVRLGTHDQHGQEYGLEMALHGEIGEVEARCLLLNHFERMREKNGLPTLTTEVDLGWLDEGHPC